MGNWNLKEPAIFVWSPHAWDSVELTGLYSTVGYMGCRYG